MKKRIIYILIFTLTFLLLTIAPSVSATGYTYDHKGNVIYSTEGLTANETPYIYSDLGIAQQDEFKHPKDLFLYNDDGETIMYLLDSGSSKDNVPAALFLLDGSYHLNYKITYLVYNPNDFSDEALLSMKSRGKLVIDPNSEAEITDMGEGKEYYAANDYGFRSLEELRQFTKVRLYLWETSSVYRSVKTNSYPITDYLYLCDKSNNQVLVADNTAWDSEDETYELRRVVTSPYELIERGIIFSPSKVTVDAAGRIYIIDDNVTDGIMEFSEAGEFERYVGTNYVSFTAWQIFWKNFSTDAQLSAQTNVLNTSFRSMTYKNNMIYATSYKVDNGNDTYNDQIMIKKINPSGKDVLRRNGYIKPMGDFLYSRSDNKLGYYGPSQLDCITINDYGVYTVVDGTRGRLYTYDNEGNLLYISAGGGNQMDKIKTPEAIQYYGENILVLDSYRKAIIVFEPTDIAKVINKAVFCEYQGRPVGEYVNGEYVEGAYDYWTQVIKLNANYEYAYIGIGKYYLNMEKYKDAMENFKLGYDQMYYGKAFKQYRDAIIKKWFAPVIITLIVLIVGTKIYKKVRRKKLGIKDEVITGIGDE